MLTATAPCLPAASRVTRINSPCALCSAPIVGTSTRRFTFGRACAAAMVVRSFTSAALSRSSQCANAMLRSEEILAGFPGERLQERHDVRVVLGRRSWRAEDCPPYQSQHQDKNTGDHQCEHPDKIDVEPCPA